MLYLLSSHSASTKYSLGIVARLFLILHVVNYSVSIIFIASNEKDKQPTKNLGKLVSFYKSKQQGWWMVYKSRIFSYFAATFYEYVS